MAYHFTGRPDRAGETLQRLETLHASNAPFIRRVRRATAVWDGRWSEAAG